MKTSEESILSTESALAGWICDQLIGLSPGNADLYLLIEKNFSYQRFVNLGDSIYQTIRPKEFVNVSVIDPALRARVLEGIFACIENDQTDATARLELIHSIRGIDSMNAYIISVRTFFLLIEKLDKQAILSAIYDFEKYDFPEVTLDELGFESLSHQKEFIKAACYDDSNFFLVEDFLTTIRGGDLISP